MGLDLAWTHWPLLGWRRTSTSPLLIYGVNQGFYLHGRLTNSAYWNTSWWILLSLHKEIEKQQQQKQKLISILRLFTDPPIGPLGTALQKARIWIVLCTLHSNPAQTKESVSLCFVGRLCLSCLGIPWVYKQEVAPTAYPWSTHPSTLPPTLKQTKPAERTIVKKRVEDTGFYSLSSGHEWLVPKCLAIRSKKKKLSAH